MNNRIFSSLLVLSFVLSGCGGAANLATPTKPATEVPLTNTAIPPTSTNTYTPEPTNTPTKQPTATETPTNTQTATPTLTPTVTRTPLPPPTVTYTPSPRPEAPHFPQTIMHPYSGDDFRKELAELVNFNQTFVNTLIDLVKNGGTGSCNAFYSYRNEEIVSQAGYFDVPEVAYATYYQYRVLVHDAVAAVGPITSVCDAGGGTITLEQDLAIIAALSTVVERGQQLQAAAATLP